MKSWKINKTMEPKKNNKTMEPLTYGGTIEESQNLIYNDETMEEQLDPGSTIELQNYETIEPGKNLQTIEPWNKHRIMELWKYHGTK